MSRASPLGKVNSFSNREALSKIVTRLFNDRYNLLLLIILKNKLAVYVGSLAYFFIVILLNP